VEGREEILRFHTSERQLHWAIAVPFMISYATALVLVTLYNPHPDRPLRFIFSWTHRISGVWLSILPVWTMIRHRRDVHLYLQNIREAWIWTVDDLKWLVLMGPAALSSRVTLPHQGKFNAAEKINFMAVMATYPLYIVTGLLIWLPGIALSAWLVHFSIAVMATPLLLGHIFMATVNPETRVGLKGMFTGFVPREWARHHYRRWYDETFGGETDGTAGGETIAIAASETRATARNGTIAAVPVAAVVATVPVAVVVATEPVAVAPAPVPRPSLPRMQPEPRFVPLDADWPPLTPRAGEPNPVPDAT
jgi:formate dehydrogenase subunit gamma